MLTQETKRKIDSARQILVGKVPDPKSQIAQITFAILYKFIDDMDSKAEELGGKRTFFVGEMKKFSWSKLFDPKLSGFEKWHLYNDALTEILPNNSHLPQLFRDVFKNALVPYRDYETLRLFLKEIDGFTYSHNEDLGDAFEYLLSILGSQGDAGQFRTPRHIIDFIVSVLDPKKNETVLDPACGTAGFLISAYRYVLDSNKGKNGQPGSLLTPDEKRKLQSSFIGYDISPDMVNLSKINMFFHGFSSPCIYEYDTLSSDEKWDEHFDVIMANPPFMSPSGGIRPHKRFSVQANRAEVLFVDYIREHLRPNGRAGIIVPEGIIFQSSGAYKQLRKILVEDGLFAVVSLPQGVFNPYAGVKTSILFFDNTIAKKSDKILFVRVLSDGFDLGAQRRPIDKNDLVRPGNEVDATKVLKAQRIAVETGKKNPWLQENSLFAYEISKEQIAQSGDYNLSAERYRLDNIGELKHQKYPMVELGEVCNIIGGSTPLRSEKSYWDNGTISWFTIDDIRNQGRIIRKTAQKVTQKALEKTSLKMLPPKTVLLCCTASVGEYAITEIETTTNQQFNGLVVKDEYIERLIPEFLFSLSKTFKSRLLGLSGKTSFDFVSAGSLKKIKIPLPPIKVQKEIVEQIEVKQSAIEHAKAIIENLERERRYFGLSLRDMSGVETVGIKDAVFIQEGPGILSSQYTNQGYPIINVGNVRNGSLDLSKTKFVSDEMAKGKWAHFRVEAGDILFTTSGTIGRVARVKKEDLPLLMNTSVVRFRSLEQKRLDSKYLYYILQSSLFVDELLKMKTGMAQFNVGPTHIKQLKIPIPTLEVQKRMVEEIEKEEEIIVSNCKLIEVMEKKICDVLGQI